MAPVCRYAGLDGLCEQVRVALAGWVPRLLGAHVHRSVRGPADVARLVAAVADAAGLTVLPGDGPLARAELHAAAVRALAAARGRPGAEARAELAAARAGCRRAAVALGVPVPVVL